MYITTKILEDNLEYIRSAPSSEGSIDMIVRRPETGQREVLDQGELSIDLGLVGDNWSVRGSSKTEDGSSHPEMQLNLMNSRVTSLVAGSKDRWKLAGDQFYVDLDLSKNNLPPGTILSLGEAKIQVTEIPHLGCLKFVDRFGKEAMKFINSKTGRSLNMRGINAKVIKPGVVKMGDLIRKD